MHRTHHGSFPRLSNSPVLYAKPISRRHSSVQSHHLSRHGHSRHEGGWHTHTHTPPHKPAGAAEAGSHVTGTWCLQDRFPTTPHCSPSAQPSQVGKDSQCQKSPRQVASSWEDHAAAFLRLCDLALARLLKTFSSHRTLAIHWVVSTSLKGNRQTNF